MNIFDMIDFSGNRVSTPADFCSSVGHTNLKNRDPPAVPKAKLAIRSPALTCQRLPIGSEVTLSVRNPGYKNQNITDEAETKKQNTSSAKTN